MKTPFEDFGRPRPWLDPGSWPHHPKAGATALIPLELVLSCGGPLRRYFDTLAAQNDAAVRLSLVFFRGTKGKKTVQQEIRTAAAQEWLSERHVRLVIDGGNPDEAFNLLSLRAPAEILSGAVSESATLREWAQSFQPDFSADAALTDYLREFPEATLNPWEGLRFFAGFLRQGGHPGAVAFARGFAQAQALHSPQDEQTERASLNRNQVMLNPTTHLVTSADGVTCYWRKGEHLEQVALDVASAALVDELQESGRIEKSALLASAAPYASAKRLDDVLTDLARRGLLLQLDQG